MVVRAGTGRGVQEWIRASTPSGCILTHFRTAWVKAGTEDFMGRISGPSVPKKGGFTDKLIISTHDTYAPGCDATVLIVFISCNLEMRRIRHAQFSHFFLQRLIGQPTVCLTILESHRDWLSAILGLPKDGVVVAAPVHHLSLRRRPIQKVITLKIECRFHRNDRLVGHEVVVFHLRDTCPITDSRRGARNQSRNSQNQCGQTE